jgi:hypothetical protein
MSKPKPKLIRRSQLFRSAFPIVNQPGSIDYESAKSNPFLNQEWLKKYDPLVEPPPGYKPPRPPEKPKFDIISTVTSGSVGPPVSKRPTKDLIATRAAIRQTWWKRVRHENGRDGWSLLDLEKEGKHRGGASYKTLQKFLDGITTRWTPKLRAGLAKTMDCDISEIPE